jgi:hypothetical protein
MLTRAIILFLAMMTGLSTAEAADRSRSVASAQGMRSAAVQLLSDVQSERVERRVRLPLTALQSPRFCASEQCDLFLVQGQHTPIATTRLTDRPRT